MNKWKPIKWKTSNSLWQGQTVVNEDGSFIIDKISFGVQCILSASIPTTKQWTDEPLTEPRGHPRAFLGLQNGTQDRYKAVFA